MIRSVTDRISFIEPDRLTQIHPESDKEIYKQW